MTSLLVRRTTLSIASVAVSALIVAVAVVPAEAHAIIELRGTPAYAGQASRLTMEIQHGCNPASKVPNVFPTTRVSAYFNSRFGTVTPRALKGWAVSRTVLANGTQQLTWRATGPAQPFGMPFYPSMRVQWPHRPGVYGVVVRQFCAGASLSWNTPNRPATATQPSPPLLPLPTVRVLAAPDAH